jgi:UDP-N-acetylglucosamine--N-acetylmuramyl-(pentapeptide) pyrophosphoryl-undecaprenol N-acetylglucosamine transferase
MWDGAARSAAHSLAYVGGRRGLESALVPRTGVPSYFLPMAPPTSPRGVILLALATLRCIALLLRLRPKVTFATGGYVSVPVALASRLLHIPLVLFLPDVVPGKAVARLAPLARSIAVTSDAALAHLPAHRTIVTGYPVRDVFRAASRTSGRRRFRIPDDALVLCVFGGSQGSRAINEAVAPLLPGLLTQYHVLHICGEQRLPEAQRAASGLPDEPRSRYHLFPYLHDEAMAGALAAADLAVCRSGASTLGELPAVGLPAILIPLPEAAVHQRENARVLADAGAAVILDESDIGRRLGPTIEGLLGDRQRLTEMAQAARALDRPDAADAIARLILSTAAS